MEKKPIVKLRVYRGTELNYDANANVKNENHLISLIHGTKQWMLSMKNLSISGYCKVVVEKVFKNLGDSKYQEIKEIGKWEKEVESYFEVKKEVALTPDQVKINELTATVETLKAQVEGSLGKGSQAIIPEDNKVLGAEKTTTDNKESGSQSLDNNDSKNDSKDVFTGEGMTLEQLQEEYEKVVGSKPHHMSKEPKLIEKIKEALAKQK